MNQNKVPEKRKRICIVATVPIALKWFMAPHIYLLKESYDVTLIANGSAQDVEELLVGSVSFIPVNIERKISLVNDVLSLIKLWKLFKNEKFDCVHSIMPKSGLLAMLAGRFACIPLRIHTFTGQVWSTRRGMGRLVLKFMDKILAMSATQVLADGQSQRQFLIENNITSAKSISVLANGSMTGVNISRFNFSAVDRQKIRLEHQIPNDAIVFLFLGRLTREKGLKELLGAFNMAGKENVGLHLMIVGPDEGGGKIEISEQTPGISSRVHRVGLTNIPECYMSAADVFCLPSHREGFGSVIIEAASIGLPTIASKIYGIVDAVEEGVTGILHAPGSAREIASSMLLLAENKDLRIKMGEAARVRAIGKFSETRVTKALYDFYRDMFSRMES